MVVNTAAREIQLLAARFIASDPDDFEFPEDMVCPITQSLMTDPVSVAQEGHVFERAAIANWFQTRDTNPVTNTRLGNKTLTPCIPVRKRIQEFRDAVTRLGGAAALPGAAAPQLRPLVPVARNPRAPEPAGGRLREGSAVVRFTPLPALIPTQREALKQLRKCPVDEGNYTAVLGTYLQSKFRNVACRSVASTEYQYSASAVAEYNHVMHKLERLSGAFLATNQVARRAWEAALRPFRRQLYDSLCRRVTLVTCFARNIPGGRMKMPELDDWSLGLKRNSWFQGLVCPAAAPYRGALSDAAVECLQQVQTVFLIDDSGSMALPGHTSWAADPDYRVRARDESRWEQPAAGTPLGRRIHDILDAYMSTLRYDRGLKPLNLVVFTDGEANDAWLLHWSIEEHVTHVIKRGYIAHQLGIEFLQVGDDWDATRHLMELEEEVSRHHCAYQRDVVGVTPVTNFQGRMGPNTLLNIVVSGIQARINGQMRRRRVNV